MRLLTPRDAPSWMLGFARDVEGAIRGARDHPLCLQGLVTSALPVATDFPRGLVYDLTAGIPKISNGTAWLSVALLSGNQIWTGRQDVGSHIRTTGSNVSGLGGAGMELYFEADAGQVLAYNRTTAAYKALNLQGSAINIKAGGAAIATYASSGLALTSGKTIAIDGQQLLTARQTGWGAPTGTATRSAFATSIVTLEELAQRVKALIDDLRTHGLINN